MKKQEYIELLITDNETAGDKKKLFNDVIDCVDIALSQTSSNFEVDSAIGLEELWAEIAKAGKTNLKNNIGSVGPFEAAEIIASKLGTKYERLSRRAASGIVNLEDFF